MTTLEFRLYFDGSFWQAQLERRQANLLQVATHCFAAEPSDAQALDWYLRHAYSLRFSLQQSSSIHLKTNSFALRQRAARKALSRPPVTPEIRALAQLCRLERRKAARKLRNATRLAEQQIRHQQAKEKQKQRHRGR